MRHASASRAWGSWAPHGPQLPGQGVPADGVEPHGRAVRSRWRPAAPPQARTPRELAEASDVVVACVADPPAVERLVFAEDGILAAARARLPLPRDLHHLAGAWRGAWTRRCARRARDMLEAPVTGSKMGAEKGTLILMTGGRARGPRRADAGDDGDRSEGDLLRRDGPGLGREADRQHAHLVHARGPVRGPGAGAQGRHPAGDDARGRDGVRATRRRTSRSRAPPSPGATGTRTSRSTCW